MPRTSWVWLALAVTCGARPASAELVINECLPDPAGADTGAEFVELFNSGPDAVELDGVSLQFANGADGVWQTRWTGGTGLRLTVDGWFLLADMGWSGPVVPDTTVRLSLQNGPDAVRLVRGEEVLDLLGYGDLTTAGLCETEAAPVTSGSSLARRPDGRDSDHNAADFVAAVPTPGAANFLRWSLRAVDLVCEPPSLPRPGVGLSIVVTLRNEGWDGWPEGTVTCRTGPGSTTPTWSGCDPGQETQVTWTALPEGEGRIPLQLELDVPDESGRLVVAAGAVQVGPPHLLLTEVMAAPSESQGEWIELEARTTCDLAHHRLRDADGTWRTLPPRVMAAGDRIVLAQDAVALLAREAARTRPDECTPDPSGVVDLAGWPSLNNSAPESRAWADRVMLADSTGVVVDHVTVGGPEGDAPDGRSWERVALRPVVPGGSNWSVSTAPAGGTPGCPNSLSAAGEVTADLAVTPAVLDRRRGSSSAHIRFMVEGAGASWSVGIYDLWGAVVRSFGDDGLGQGPRDLLWEGGDDGGGLLEPGGYIVLLTVADPGGRIRHRARTLVVVR